MASTRMSRAVVLAATVALSAAAGWAARGPGEKSILVTTVASPAAPSGKATAEPAAPPPPAAPLIVVARDGNVTLRVEQQPLEWVLEQIAAQSGWGDVHERARAAAPAASVPAAPRAAAAAEAVCAPAVVARVDPQHTLLALASPGEEQRYLALAQARSDGVAVPEATLRALMDGDPSERVRLAAFESLLESRVDERLFRETLEAAQVAASVEVRREARRRLDELQEMERMAAQYARAAPP